MGDRTFALPVAVRLKAEAAGRAGARWAGELPGLVARVEREWDVTVGAVLPGGSEALVVEAVTAAGERAVLKVALPAVSVVGEAAVLRAAAGRGYARLLAADERRGVLLLERLGPPLFALGVSVERQIEVICQTLAEAWQTPTTAAGQTGAEKAAALADFISETWERLAQPCSEAVIAEALRCAEARRKAHDETAHVLVHGDPHAANALRDEERPERFKLVDPDGLLAEPAYDLSVPMRDWSTVLLAAPDPRGAAEARCRLLSRLTGVPSGPIWEWGFVERASTGLLLLSVGDGEAGREMLLAAEALLGR